MLLHDEMSTDGYDVSLIELLVQVVILNETQVQITGLKRCNTCENWKSKRVCMCLDGLSIDRHRCFYRKLLKLPFSFIDSFKQEIEFQKTFRRVSELSRPLHVSFHMLQRIYNLYRGFLKTSQKCVECKNQSGKCVR